MNSHSPLCTNCILTDKTPGIHFDNEGVCNYCRSHVSPPILGEAQLRFSLEQVKEKCKEKKYDCIIGLSGGRDSTYTLWKLVADYGMRVLAVHYNNPFTSQQAHENIANAISILKIDCVHWDYPDHAHERTTKKALEAWMHRPSSAFIPVVCTYCKLWWPEFFNIAHQHNINLVVIGSNPLETASFKKVGLGGARTYHRISNLPRLGVRILKEITMNPRYLYSLSWPAVLKAYLVASHSSPYIRWRYKDINVIRLFDYIRWDEKLVESTISQNLNWKKSPEAASSWRFDCRLDFVRRRMYSSTTGVTELRDLFSKMIREGLLKRDEALTRITKEDYVDDAVLNHVLHPLGIKLNDLPLQNPCTSSASCLPDIAADPS
jgi:hypothetical protein